MVVIPKHLWTPCTVLHQPAGIRDFDAAVEETCFIVVMPGHIDAVLGKLLAVGGGGGANTKVSAAALASSRLLRTKLFRPHKVQT